MVIIFSLDLPMVDWCYLIWRYEVDILVMTQAVTLSHLLAICPPALLGESDFVPFSYHRL
jgi:hypothetical protein